MNITLQTDRLILRPFTLDDTAFIIELLNSPGWIEFIGERNVRTSDQAITYLRNGPLKSYAANGFGLSMVELKDGNVPVAMCGLLKRDQLDHPDIGFAFLPEYFGKGYAYEIAKATLDHALHTLKLPEIQAITVPHNVHSIRLLGKIGMKFIKSFSFPDNSEELFLYSSKQ